MPSLEDEAEKAEDRSNIVDVLKNFARVIESQGRRILDLENAAKSQANKSGSSGKFTLDDSLLDGDDKL